MYCEHCEAAYATLECLECTVKNQEFPVQLCDECSEVIHKGRMSNHTLTPKEMTPGEQSRIKKQELRKKLDTTYGLRAGLESRVSDIGSAQRDLQTRIRGYERELRATVTEIQNRVKDRCRNLYTGVKEELNNTCMELTDKEAILKDKLSAIRQVSDEVERAIRDMDEDEFLEATNDLEGKIAAVQEVSPIELPDMDIHLQVDVGDIEAAIQAIYMKHTETDKSFDIPPILQDEGSELKVYVPGRMTRDGTFCVQPELPDEVYTALDRMNTAIRTHYIQQLDWQTFADSGVTPAIGEQVFVLFSSENKWYRARVEEVRPDKTCAVIYTDFGNIEHVNLKLVLPKRRGLFPDVPTQTLECSLFPTLRSDLSNAARWAFSDLVNDTQCTCRLMSKVEGIARDVWQVELSVIAEDGSLANVSDVVQASIDEAETGSSAIKCRDVRLLDNPEVYSKLRTVTIERPSNKNKGHDDGHHEVVMVIPPINGVNDSSPAADSADHENDVPENGTDVSDGTGQEQDPVDEEEERMPVAVAEDAPVEIGVPHTATGASTKPRAGSDAEECEPGALRGVADSPSCDDYQSAASSLDDHSGSITPVSASSHLSNTASSPAMEPTVMAECPVDPTTIVIDVPTGGVEECLPIPVEVEEKPRPDKKKKKKKRAPRKDSEDDKMALPATLVEKAPIVKPEPVLVEDVQKPFVVTDWLRQMGKETLGHQTLRNNIQGVAKLLTSSDKLAPGELILGLDDRDIWQRAVVTGFKGRKVDVHFLDTMKEKSVNADTGVRIMLSKLRSLPPAIILPEDVQRLVADHYMEAGEQFIPMPPEVAPITALQETHPPPETNDTQPQDEQDMYPAEDGIEQTYVPLMEVHGNDMNHMDPGPPHNFQQDQPNWGNQSNHTRGLPEGRRRRYDNQDSWDNMDQRSDHRGQRAERNDRGDRSDRGDRRDRRDGRRGDRHDQGGQGGRGGDRRGDRPITCYNCGDVGHMHSECGQQPKPQHERDGSTVVCYSCSTEGHYSRECPYKPQSGNSHPHQRGERRDDRRRDNRRQGGGGKPRNHRHQDDRGSWRGDRNDRPSDNRPSGGGGGSSRQSYSSEIRSTEAW